MKLVIIFGPHAVGKMTVGQELAKLTNLKLFHNHMTIDLVSNFFDFSNPEAKRLVGLFRKEIFTSVANSDLEGLIFTYMWALDDKRDWDYIESVVSIFEKTNSRVYYVELEADYDVRWERNTTSNRLENKPSKRNIDKSQSLFKEIEEKDRLNSFPNEIKFKNYLKINNTNLSPDKVAKVICDHFSFNIE